MPKFGSNIVLPASPAIDEKKYPDLFAELLYVHNAIFALQSYLDLFTAAKFTVIAAVTIPVGRTVSISSVGGNLIANLANATTGTKPCVAFALSDIIAGSSGDVQSIGLNELLTGLVPGTTYYQSTTGGVITDTPPAAAGNLIQEIGIAISPTALLFRPAFNWKQL